MAFIIASLLFGLFAVLTFFGLRAKEQNNILNEGSKDEKKQD